MIAPIRLLGLAMAGAAFGAPAAEFPLQVKNMTMAEARRCPGGYGVFSMLSASQPPELKKAPAPVSAHPLYARTAAEAPGGRTGTPGSVWLFRFDESQGTGKGYDRLIVDLNQNGDLTDDPVAEAVPGQRPAGSNERASFGSIELPAAKTVGAWHPRFYADIYLFNQRAIRISDARMPIGQLNLKAGNYLEAEVEVASVKVKLGVVDGNCNFQLGDLTTLFQAQPGPGEPQRWHVRSGDYFVRDLDIAGRAEPAPGNRVANHFSSVLYFGAKPFTVALAPDLRSLRVEPFTGPTGALQVPAQVAELVLALEKAPQRWEVLTPEPKEGQTVLPQGTYRMVKYTLSALADGADWTRAVANEVADKTVKVEAGATAKLEAGLPLSLALTATRSQADTEAGLWARIRSALGSKGSPSQVVNLDVKIHGAGGERYTSFFAAKRQVEPPRFAITDSAGKEIDAGAFQFG